MGKINLQWADLAFIIMFPAAHAYRNEKGTLFIKNCIFYREKHILRDTFFEVLCTFAVNVTRPEASSYLLMMKVILFPQYICLFLLYTALNSM